MPPAVVSAELAHRRWATTAASLVELLDSFVLLSGDGTQLLCSLRAETSALRGCGASLSVPVLTPREELKRQYFGVKTVTTFMPVWFHPASNKHL